jgi:hypothetical protein
VYSFSVFSIFSINFFIPLRVTATSNYGFVQWAWQISSHQKVPLDSVNPPFSTSFWLYQNHCATDATLPTLTTASTALPPKHKLGPPCSAILLWPSFEGDWFYLRKSGTFKLDLKMSKKWLKAKSYDGYLPETASAGTFIRTSPSPSASPLQILVEDNDLVCLGILMSFFNKNIFCRFPECHQQFTNIFWRTFVCYCAFPNQKKIF